jgi:uncharacterized protein (DUF433 family)
MKSARNVVHSDPEIMGGTPVFRGTRVPVQTLLDYLEAGHSLAEFLDDFPSVTREQAIAVLGCVCKLGSCRALLSSRNGVRRLDP